MTAQGSMHATVRKLWPGETFVILGGGSSLTREDVAFCHGKARVIAIKEAYHLAPWADVLYGCDEKFWRAEHGVGSFTGLKYALQPQPPLWPDLQVLRNTGMEGLELDPTGLRTGQNSGYQAVGLAYHLGAARILLLGFDMWPGPDGRQNWHEGQPFVKAYHVRTPYAVLLQLFPTIVEPLKAAGVEVFNCTNGFSALACFPKSNLRDVLGARVEAVA